MKRISAGLAWLALALLAILPACGWPTAKVGPHPAIITVQFKAAVSPQTLQAALAQPLAWSSFDAWATGYGGPYWTLYAWLIDEKKGRRTLPRADKGGGLLTGLAVDAAVRLKAPPGRHRLRLELACAIDRYWTERIERWEVIRTKRGDRLIWAPDHLQRTSRINLLLQVSELELTLGPDQALTLRPFDQPAAAPPPAK